MSRGLLALLLLATPAPQLWAQISDAQRAIEVLEGCTSKERRRGCIKILKRESRGEGLEAIKAQVRGGRIIWYEFDPRTGRARRTN